MLPRDILAFDEGERILIMSFLGKSLSRVLRTSPKAIDRNAIRFQALGAILDWLTDWLAGYVAQIALISRANVFLAALSLRHRFFFSAQSVKKNTFTRDRMHFAMLVFSTNAILYLCVTAE